MRLGSLCSGYGGLEMGVSMVLDVQTVWVADNSPASERILKHHYPDVPNLGDITTIDWARVEPVDIICAGFPCQDVSMSGSRTGLRKGTRTGIWVHVADAIETLRPSLVILENVRGLLSADADCDMEPCPWCVGDTGAKSAVRALGAVLADLARIGFDAEWSCVRAADIGTPHRRERVFILAWPRATDTPGSRLARI
ncbi:DNA cytosine methyltransferase [Actinomadura sp. 9N215]|uniref:DNA cytosine methyltransferase n=1 Tax=Actinomadura sp. 9N215 TaxID=3375150 RepID=UPI00378F9051